MRLIELQEGDTVAGGRVVITGGYRRIQYAFGRMKVINGKLCSINEHDQRVFGSRRSGSLSDNEIRAGMEAVYRCKYHHSSYSDKGAERWYTGALVNPDKKKDQLVAHGDSWEILFDGEAWALAGREAQV